MRCNWGDNKAGTGNWSRSIFVGSAFAAILAAFPADGQTIKLNNEPVFPASSNGVDPNFSFIEGGTRVVFAGELTSSGYSDVYAASTTAAGTQVQLTATQPVVNGFQTDYMTSYAVSPDGSMVVFGRRIAATSTYDLRRVLVSAPQVETTLSENIGVFFEYPVVITSDGSRVIFMTRKAGNDYGIYSSSTASLNTPLKLNSPFPAGASPDSLFLVDAPSGTRAFYVGYNLNIAGFREIFSAPINAASGQIVLNSAPVADGNVNDSSLARVGTTAGGTSVIFSGDHVVNNVVSMYKSSTTAAGTQTELSTSFNPDGDVLGFLLAPLTNRVFYLADLFQDDKYIVFEASTTGAANQKAVYYPTENYAGIRQVSLTPDEKYLVLRGSLTSSGIDDLYTAPTTFQFAPRRVTQLASTDDIADYTVSPDGTFVVYTQSAPSASQSTLWVVSATGQYAPVKIGPISTDLRIKTFKINPNNSNVVYTAYIPAANTSTDIYTLYSVPIPALETVANPIPAAPAAVIPAQPTPGTGTPGTPSGETNRPPTLTVLGKKKISTPGQAVTIKGTATDDRGVVSVLATYKKVSASGKRKTVTKTAKLAGGSWKFKFRPTEKPTKLTFQSVDAQGVRSTIAKVKVVRQ